MNTQPNPVLRAPDDAPPFTQEVGDLIDPAELQQLAQFIHHATRRSIPAAKALLRWCEEVIIRRDEAGTIHGVHGLRFLDVMDGWTHYRVVYVVITVTDESGPPPAVQTGQVGTRIFGRERRLRPNATMVWVNSPACDPEMLFSGGALRPVRQLIVNAKSGLAQNMRFFTDAPERSTDDTHVPPPVEQFVTNVVAHQMSIQRDAQMGAIPRVPVWGRISLAALAVSAAAIFLVPRQQMNSPGPAIVAEKGSATLRVFRQSDSGSEELISGAPVKAGDRIRFVIDLPDRRRVRVVGVEPSGNLYSAWPVPGSSASDVNGPGDGLALDGAQVLDASTGRETLYLVACQPTIAEPTCKSAGTGPPTCPPGCTVSPFVLDKQPPK